jgi:hypothetical protein
MITHLLHWLGTVCLAPGFVAPALKMSDRAMPIECGARGSFAANINLPFL